MYFYSLHGFESNTILMHEKEFTQQEFEKMCKEVPFAEVGSSKVYDEGAIEQYLKSYYGFKDLNITADLFTDADIEEGD